MKKNINNSLKFATLILTSSLFIFTSCSNKNNQQKLDPQQEAMQKTMGKTMPIVLTATFFFIDQIFIIISFF